MLESSKVLFSLFAVVGGISWRGVGAKERKMIKNNAELITILLVAG